MKSNCVNKITVITLVYNNHAKLSETIESVKRQIFSNKYKLEYIIADDGSIDFDRENIELQLVDASFDTKVIVNTRNLGTVKTFNKAIRSSTGDIIVPLSADDSFFDNNSIQKIAETFDNTNVTLATGKRIFVSEDNELKSLPLDIDLKTISDSRSLTKHLLHKSNIISGSVTYYRRKMLEERGLFDEKYSLLEDLPFVFNHVYLNNNIHVINHIIIKYGTDGVSSKKEINPRLKNDFITFYKGILELPNVGFFSKRYIRYHRLKRVGYGKSKFDMILFFEQYLLYKFKLSLKYFRGKFK